MMFEEHAQALEINWWPLVFSSKSSVVEYVVFLLANLFQVWVEVPAGINTIYGQQSGSKKIS